MATKKVMIEELANDLYLINSNSSIVEIISFGYSLHTLAVESGIYENNEWHDFAFGMNLKISDYFEDVIIISEQELLILADWLDWICRLIVESDSDHLSTKFMKQFLSNCDSFFSYAKRVREKERIITERTERRKF